MNVCKNDWPNRTLKVGAPLLLMLEVLSIVQAAPGGETLEAFFDGLMSAQLEALHIPGATVSVVQDGQILFAKGYGYADLEHHTPVNPDTTLFPVASVSKLFTWTAVMQLVEQKRLGLATDINTNLKPFKIPTNFPQPITLSHLMSHSAGFEERSVGEWVRTAAERKPLGEYLTSYMPARVRPPGQLSAYSNYSTSLAGYIVEQTAGLPFERYIEEHIFNPLGMAHSSFRQPLPPALARNLAIGYAYQRGLYRPQYLPYSQSVPAAALATTATDIARFMLAHLQEGSYKQGHILDPSTVKEMHRLSFTQDPRVNGWAHGFMIATFQGQHLLWHGGDIPNFHCALVLLPQVNTGLFVAYNADGGASAVHRTIQAFVSTFYPQVGTSHLPNETPEDLSRYTGTYRPARSEYTSRGKIVGLFSTLTVHRSGAEELSLELGFPAQGVQHYRALGSGRFRSVDPIPSVFGELVFRQDTHEQYLFQQNNPTTAYIRQPWYANPRLNLALVVGCVLIFASVWVAWLNSWWMRGTSPGQGAALARLPLLSARLLSGLGLVFLIGVEIMFSNPDVVLGLPAWAGPLFALPWLILFLSLALTVQCGLLWMRGHLGWSTRLHLTLLALVGLAFSVWLVYWNLLKLP